MENYRILILSLTILIIPILLIGCSNDSLQEGSSALVLTSLESLDSKTLNATFDNGKSLEIQDFTPKPLELGQKTDVSFIYNNNTYSDDVTYTIELTGNFNTSTSFFEKLLSPTAFAQTSDQVDKVILFYGDDYKTAEVINGSFELSIDREAPAGLIFADNNDGFVGYLNITDGLDTLPINSLSDDTGEIKLGEINISDYEGTSSNTFLLNIDPTEEKMLTATDDLFASIVKNPDLNKNGKIDILENGEIDPRLKGKLAFYASGGTFNSDLTIDINQDMSIGGSKFIVDYYSKNYDVPSEIEFSCVNDDISGQSSVAKPSNNRATYFSNATTGILPEDDYKVYIGSEITHTFTVSRVLANAENNLIYVIPTINLKDAGTIDSIEWQFENKNGEIIQEPSNILNTLEIQINSINTATADKYKNYPQGEDRIYNGYPDIAAQEHQLTEDIKWEDVGNISMAYNDVFMNHYVLGFNK